HVEGSQHAYHVLHRAGVLDSSHRPLEHPPQRVLARRCCRGAYLRGALLGAGSLSGPRDPHLEIRAGSLEAARFIQDVAQRSDARLALEEHAILSSLRADANRLANADEANLERVARAAHRQLEAIRTVGLDALPAELVEIAELRLRHPSASLAELAAKARPPLTKSAAHRRLQAVERLIES